MVQKSNIVVISSTGKNKTFSKQKQKSCLYFIKIFIHLVFCSFALVQKSYIMVQQSKIDFFTLLGQNTNHFMQPKEVCLRCINLFLYLIDLTFVWGKRKYKQL